MCECIQDYFLSSDWLNNTFFCSFPPLGSWNVTNGPLILVLPSLCHHGAPQWPALASSSSPTTWTWSAPRSRLTGSPWTFGSRAEEKTRCMLGVRVVPPVRSAAARSVILFHPVFVGAARAAEEGAGDRLVPGRGQHRPGVHQHPGLWADAAAQCLRGGLPWRRGQTAVNAPRQNYIRQNQWNSLLTISVLNSGLCIQDLRLPVVGSQIVGLIPLKALLDAADFYIQRDGLFVVEEEHKIRLVRQPLALGCWEILERTLAGWRSGWHLFSARVSAGDQQTGPRLSGSLQPQGARCGVSVKAAATQNKKKRIKNKI